jgi:hypothetical protein
MKEVAIFDNLFGGPDRATLTGATLIIVLGLNEAQCSIRQQLGFSN